MALRKHLTQAELRRVRKEIQHLRAGFDLLHDHVIITDESANILYANKAMEQATGFLIKDVIGKNPGDLWGGRMSKEFYKRMWDTIKVKKQPFVGEVRNVRKDGTEYWQELHISPILGVNGEVKFFIGIEPRITDRKKKEEFRREFLSAIGHQLEDPLAAIMWTLEWLSQNGEITKEQRDVLIRLYKDNPDLTRLVADLLFLASTEQEGKEK